MQHKFHFTTKKPIDFKQFSTLHKACCIKLFKLVSLYLKKNILMSDTISCPKCQSPYAYLVDELYTCPECFHEWSPNEVVEDENVVKDVNGAVLQNGDTVIVVKDLPVKGAPKPVKAGTKVKNIRLTDGDHNIDCKIDGFGAMGLKSEFVRKA